jgi:hypothetical protein
MNNPNAKVLGAAVMYHKQPACALHLALQSRSNVPTIETFAASALD